MTLLILPFLIQGALMGVDEFHFHEKRGLPKWERVGHPLDTLTTLMALLVPVFLVFSEDNTKIFLALSLFSCIFITKDEFVHSRNCGASEHYLHALQFVLHPIVFIATYFLWQDPQNMILLLIQTLVVSAFLIYQCLRWNLWPIRQK